MIYLFLLLLQQAPSAATFKDGTVDMVKRLQALQKEAEAVPQNDIFLNRQRMELLQKQLDAGGGPNIKRMLALEKLRAGYAREAAVHLEELMASMKAQGVLDRGRHAWLLEHLGLAWMRLGEQDNCIENHTSASCITPIAKAGVHTLREGSEKAIKYYTQLIELKGDDIGARWLLNIAYMTLSEYPDKVPPRFLIPPEVFSKDNHAKRFSEVAQNVGLDHDSLAGGVVVEDFNNDGFLDVLVSSWNLNDQIHYFENDGKGGWVDKTETSGLNGLTGGLNMIQADSDNDGNIDVLVLRGAWRARAGRFPNSLLKSHGDGTFSDVTEAVGLLSSFPTQTAAWADFNNDGWVDVFIGNETYAGQDSPCELYINQGDGTFVEMAAQWGADVRGYVKGVAAGDFDNDNRPDIYISILDQGNLLLRNTPDPSAPSKARFVKHKGGVSGPTNSFPTWFFDYNNDGFEDIFVADYAIQNIGDIALDYMGKAHFGEEAGLFRNKGDGTFEEVTKQAGLDTITLAMGSNYGDLDGDGFLDFYIGSGRPALDTLMPNRMFRNVGGQGFEDITGAAGFGHLQKGHGVAFADFDHDGDQDVFAVMGGAYSGDTYRNALFENPGYDHRFLVLHLRGRTQNRGAIGTRIRVVLRDASGEREIHRTVRSGGSFGGSPLRQNIGLGKAQEILSVTLRWPTSGESQELGALKLDSAWTVEEGQQPKPLPYRSVPFNKAGGMGHHHH